MAVWSCDCWLAEQLLKLSRLSWTGGAASLTLGILPTVA